ncbi:MAG: diguanylate cyclase [Chloroflexia bacterium]|nr:diguanylate cyclase [Chloroflexia bacterium]
MHFTLHGKRAERMMNISDRFDHRLRQASLILYAVSTLLVIVAANVPGWNDRFERMSLNVLSLSGLLCLLAVKRFPWHRFHRNLFLIMTVSSAGIVALVVHFTGGSKSPFNAYFFLMVIFCALYYTRAIAVAAGALITLVSLLPLADPDSSSSAVLFHVVLAVSYIAAVWAGTIMAAELVSRERVRQRLEADLTEIRELRDGLARRTAQLEVVHDVGKAIAAVLAPEALYRTLVHTMYTSAHFGDVSVFVPTETDAKLELVATVSGHGSPDAFDAEPMASNVPDVVTRAAATHQPSYSTQARHGTPSLVRPELAVPIVAGQELLGVLAVSASNSRSFDATDATTLEAVADYAATALQNAHAHVLLTREATTDALTGLRNHRGLIERMDSEIERAERFGHALSLLYFDIDRFKDINDTYGHEVGDAVLQQITRLALSVLRSIDTLGRYGGEEFVVLLPETDADAALQSAERLRQAVTDHAFAVDLEIELQTTVSIGVATYPADGASRRTLLRSADGALYRAKRLGRNQVRTAIEHETPKEPARRFDAVAGERLSGGLR